MTDRKTAIIVQMYEGVFCGMRAHAAPRYEGDDETWVVRPLFMKDPTPGLVVVYDSVRAAERSADRLRRFYFQHSLAVVS